MGRIAAKKIRGMGWMPKTSLVLIFTLMVSAFMHGGLYSPQPADAAITALQAWSNVYHGTATTAQSIAYPVPAGSGTNRLLVVAISTSRTTVGSRTVTLTYGGQTLTPVAGDMATATIQQHTQLYYLNEAGLDAAGANTTLSVTVSGGTTRMTDVFAAVFDGIDQTAPIGDSRTYNSGTTASAGPHAFNPALTVTAGDQAVEIINCSRTASTALRTITYAANWTMQQEQTSTVTDAIRNAVANRSIPATDTSDASSTSFSGTALASMTGMTVHAAFGPPAPPPPPVTSGITSCAGCHQYTPTFADGTARDVPPGQFPGSHQPHVQNSGYACSVCHVVPATETAADFEHRDGIIQMVVAAGTYSKGLSFAQSNTAPFVGGTCSTATCHANVYGSGSATTPAWGTTGAGCSACHSVAIASTGPNTGSHAAHNDTVCTDCHNAGTTATTVPATGHADGNIDVTNGYPANVTKHAAGTYTGTCSTAVCHANVYGTGSVTTPVWGTASGCGACHSVAIAASGPNTGSHALHNVTDCSQCHAGATNNTTVPTANHADGNIDVTNGYPANVTKHAAGTYTGTCSTASCHANVYGTGTVTTPVWGPTASTGCTGCHSGTGAIAATGPNTGAHARHNITDCSQCHQGATNSSTVPTANHGDGNIDVTNGYPANVIKHAIGTYTGNCTTAYCHSAGTSLTAPSYASIAWGATTTCASCHTGGTATGPTYANGTPKANSHAVHVVSSGITCNVCHNDVTTTGTTITNSAGHANRAYNIQPSAVQYTITTTGTPTTPTACSAITCHGNGSATWGGTVQCQGCHMNTSADVNDFTGTFWNNGTTSTINSTEWTTRGHGTTAAYASGNPAAGFTVANACLYCHDNTVAHKTTTNPFRLKNFADATWGKNGNCQSCHATGSAGVTVDTVLKNSTSKVDSYHYGAKHTTTNNGGQFCWDCHDPHGDSNVFMVHATVASRSDATTGAPTTTVATTFTTFTSGTGYIKTTAPFDGICNVCHTATGHYTATAGDGHNSTTRCTTCHSHSGATGTAGFAAAGGDCVGCHATAQGTRSAIGPEFGLAWGHKKSGRGAVAAADCIVCHLEGSYAGGVVGAAISTTAYHMNGNIDLRDPDGTGETPVTNNSGAAFTFTKYSISFAAGSRTTTLGNTVAEVVTVKFCMRCHDANGATNPTARSNNGGTGTAFMPFGGINLGANYTTTNGAAAAGGLVNVANQFLSTNSSRHPVGAPNSRAYPYSTRLAAPYNNIGTTRDANTTAANTASPRVKANSVVMVCEDCHNTATPLTNRTITAHGGATTLRGTYDVASPTLCTTCHTPLTGTAQTTTNGYLSSSQHTSGSAFTTGNSNISSNTRTCHNCHTSNFTPPARPIRAADYHGFNGLLATGGPWTYGNGNGIRPIAFMRNTARWTTTSPRPYVATGITAGQSNCGGSANLGSGCSNQNHGNYSPGGSY